MSLGPSSYLCSCGTLLVTELIAKIAINEIIDLQQNSLHDNFSWSGSEYAMWQGKLADIDDYLNKTTDPTVAKIIKEFKKYVTDRAADAREKEYRREVEGI